MRNIQSKRGFFIIEAFLAIFLFSMVQVFLWTSEQDERMERRAAEFGRDLAEVLYAVDKRVLLDSRVDQVINPTTGVVTKGDWNNAWSTNADFFDGMLGRELIAVNNPVCGDVAGWTPKVASNDRLALVKCNLMNEVHTPFGFNFEGARTSLNPTDTHVLGEWYFLVFQPTDIDFEENFKYYSVIRNKAELHDTLEMTGQHEVMFVDRSLPNLPELTSVSACYAAKSNCAIMFKYRTSQIGELMDDPYVKVDGSTPLVGSLRFRTSAANPEKCFKPDGAEVECGLEFDLGTGNLSVNANEMTAAEFSLIFEDTGNTPVVTLCKDYKNFSSGSPVDSVCGLSVVNDSGSAVASAYLNEIHANTVYAESLETSGAIRIRQSLDPSDVGYKNYVEYRFDGVRGYYANTKTGEMLFESDGVTVDALNNDLIMKGSDINMVATNSMSLKASDIDITSDNARLKTSYNQGVNVRSKYANVRNSKLATEAQVFDGVKIVGMDVVRSGSSRGVWKKTCPATETGRRPTLQATTFPTSGFYTNIKDVGRTCKTNRSSFFRLSGDLNFSHSWSGRNQVIRVKHNVNGTIGCDPARDTSVSYRLTSSSTKWYPRYYFYGGTTGREYSNVDMTVIQYCDYTK